MKSRLLRPPAQGTSALVLVFLALHLSGCGGGSTTSAGIGGGNTPQDIPVLSSIAPSSAPAGASDLTLVLSGSSFENSATVNWNGSSLSSSWVSANQMIATVPALKLASVGTATVTVTNPGSNAGTSAARTFTINTMLAGTTWIRSVPGISTARNIAWDAVHKKLYVSIPSTDATAPNTIIPVDPLTATAGTPVPAGKDPDLLSLSSDASYLWVSLDGDTAVQRFKLPALTKDISIPLPKDSIGDPQMATSLEAARVNSNTVAFVVGPFGSGNGIYVYDGASQRPQSLPGEIAGGPFVDWIQWGADDSTIYGNQYTTIDAGGVATLSVTSSGLSLKSYNGGEVGPERPQYDKGNGNLYSTNQAFNPIDGSLIGTFAFPVGERVCTSDSSLGRYYCVFASSDGGTDVNLFELWVYDLNSYALIDRIYFGASAGIPASSVTGGPVALTRWGNAGLALVTNTGAYYGNGGLFLIDGAAINPNAPPDVPSGTAPGHYTWMASLQPQEVPVSNADVTVTINGSNFTQDSTACWNCNYLQFRFLSTTFVNSQQLSVTVPSGMLAASGQIPINVFDSSTNLFSSDSLSLIVNSPPGASSSTKVQAVGLAGLAMAGDTKTGSLYVATAQYDGAYPNAIVSVDGNTGSVGKTLVVGSDPDLLSLSSDSAYLYVGYADATKMSQVPAPALQSPLTWSLHNPVNSAVYWAGDLRAAPENPHTTAITLFNLRSYPSEIGGVVVYDDNVERPGNGPNSIQSLSGDDTLAWGPSDQVLTGAGAGGPLVKFQVTQVGPTFVSIGTATFNNGGFLHSDFATGLIYSDAGLVADPNTQAIVGNYQASGIALPDSSLNRLFIIGQTASQGGTNDFTIQSFDQKAYTLVSSITIENLVGTPIDFVRWGPSGLAVLTSNGGYGSTGMLYLIQDSQFVSGTKSQDARISKLHEFVQRRWKSISKADLQKIIQAKRPAVFR